MTRREIANLCCRVLAVYALLQGIGRLSLAGSLLWPLMQTSVSSNEALLGAVMGAAEPLLWLASGAFLWRWSGLIAAWMLGTDLHHDRNEPEPSPQRISAEAVHAIAFSTIGLWVLIESVPTVLSYLVQLGYVRIFSQQPMQREASAAWVAAWMVVLLRLALGLYLLFGASGLVRLLRGLRDVGLQEHRRPGYPGSDTGDNAGTGHPDALHAIESTGAGQ